MIVVALIVETLSAAPPNDTLAPAWNPVPLMDTDVPPAARPLLGATEVDKPGAPPRCIRVLLHWNTSRRQDEIVHVYLRGSDAMRAHDPPSHLASTAHTGRPSA